MTKIGYARTSTAEQNISMQIAALEAAGVSKIFRDEGVSGAKASRPQLDALLDYVREGDAVVVYKLDRLGRSVSNLLHLVEHELRPKQIDLISLNDPVDTTTPSGRLMFTMLAALAELERDTIRGRTMDGLAAARAGGRTGGRKHSLSEADIRMVQTLKDAGIPSTQIAEQFGVSRATIYNALGRLNAEG